MRENFVGVDPGERWVGIVRLSVRPLHRYSANMLVLDRKTVYLKDVVNAILRLYPDELFVESYQQRAVGHQRFAPGRTLRLIGALEYAAQVHEHSYSEVMPGNPDDELPHLPLARMIAQWPMKGASSRHGRAAWRILQRGLMARRPHVLQTIAEQEVDSDFVYALDPKKTTLSWTYR